MRNTNKPLKTESTIESPPHSFHKEDEFRTKNTYLLPKDHLLYGEWTEGLSELPRETALFFRTKAADEFVRRQLGYLNGTSPYLVRLILAEREFLAEIIQKDIGRLLPPY